MSHNRRDSLNILTTESEIDQKFSDQKAAMNATADFGEKFSSKFRTSTQAVRPGPQQQ